MIDSNTQHQAVTRLFELARAGDVDNLEFDQLDSLIYGSLERTYRVTAHGVQGHAAYPDRVRNPLHALCWFLDELASTPLDEGTDHFDPSSLQVTTIDCGNKASNVVPELATAVFNIRFNDQHRGIPGQRRRIA